MPVYIFIGTTAEFIKISPVIKELRRNHVQFCLITSGQGKINFEEFRPYLGPIKADISFEHKGEKSSTLHFAVWAVRTLLVSLVSLRDVFPKSDRGQTLLVVHGDTVSSLWGALIAYVYKLKLVHIESGLRSFNFLEPFPEEICRYLLSRVARINFCPNQWSVDNLRSRKGIKIDTFQNTLIDIHKFAVSRKIKPPHIPSKYFVLVIHRQEHVIFDRGKTLRIIKEILNATPRLPCVFIMHRLTSNFIDSLGLEDSFLKNKRLILLPRLSYFEFTSLLHNSQFVITDGGSNQEECYYLGKPCLILRNRTERIEGLGENAVLGGFSTKYIRDFIGNYKQYVRRPIAASASPSGIIGNYLKDSIRDTSNYGRN